MRFDRVRLRNFKPYADADVRLGDGVTVIHGLNGSGKSSLLEACFFALYGSGALDENLDDVITNGEEEAEIDLWFTHDGGEYHVERRLRATGEQAKTADCALEGPDEGESVDGARAVKRRVTDLLRMDDEAFVNCAYVRQGEVNKLINATPGQRQDMIDDLLQLGKLEEYRERAGQARLGVEDVLGDRRGRLSQLEDQIAQKRDQDLHDRLNQLESDRNEVDEKLASYEENKREAERTRDEAAEVLESHDETRDRLDAVEGDLSDLREEVRETESRREELREEIREKRSEVETREAELDEKVERTELDAADGETVEARLSALDARDDELAEAEQERRMEAQGFDNQSANLREKAAESEERAAEKRADADELDGEADDAVAELADRRDRLAGLEDDVEELEARFADAPVGFGEATDLRDDRRDELSDLRERERDLRADLGTVETRIEEAERLLEEGKCPECGQPVDGSPHVDSLDDHCERRDALETELDSLAEEIDDAEADVEAAESLVEAETRLRSLRDNRDDVAELIDQREAAVAEKREKAEDLREEADDLESRAAELREVAREKAEAAEEAREAAADVADERAELADARERVEEVRALREAIEALEDEVASLREKRDHLREMNETNRERLDEKRERRDELREELSDVDIDTQRERKRNAEKYLENVTEELDRLRERRDALQNDIGGVKQDLAQLSELTDRRDELAERVEALEGLHEETSDLETLYADLRAELRQRNVESLERMLNETFDLVYANDAYSHIELDGEYELTVYQKDGRALEPEQLSGGERALFNLSLRAAIYRLLAEGIEGAAPMPPLILDEPTVFLDSGHVSRLVDLVEEMRTLGVRQIIIVSHDEELVGAADDLVTVEKDPTTNRSTARREDAATLGAVEASGDD